MSALGEKAVACANASGLVFAKFLSANETGETKSHQCGIYVPKNSASLMFDAPFAPGENHVREVSITWNGEFSTKSLFKYYGTGTRDEYRITHFGRGFPFLRPSRTGDLLIICKRSEREYAAFVLESDADIDLFLDVFSLAPTQLNSLVKGGVPVSPAAEDDVLESVLLDFGGSFPDTKTMALSAREAERRPDFIFPSKEAYHDTGFPADRLMFLGAKTTCKDRWRQILNEASRISCKYLFTLQQGVSLSQLEEMHEENVVLVVPKMYHQAFPGTSFEVLISLEEFIARVKGNQGLVERGAGAAFG